jgi:hypothetical protein
MTAKKQPIQGRNTTGHSDGQDHEASADDVIYFSDSSSSSSSSHELARTANRQEQQELAEAQERLRRVKARLETEPNSQELDEKDEEEAAEEEEEVLQAAALNYDALVRAKGNAHCSGSPTNCALVRVLGSSSISSGFSSTLSLSSANDVQKASNWQVYSTWSDGWLRRYDLPHGRTVWKTRLRGRPTALAANDLYVAVGLSTGLVRVFSVRTNREAVINVAPSILHRAMVTAIAFGSARGGRLYTGSADLTVKVWQVNEASDGESETKEARLMTVSYLDTLHGHLDTVLSLSANTRTPDKVLSVGARDRTCRLWKLVDETQLIFRGSPDTDGDSLQTVLALDSDHFVTAGSPPPLSTPSSSSSSPPNDNSLEGVENEQDIVGDRPKLAGGLSLWQHGRKKPVHRTRDGFSAQALARCGPFVFACPEESSAIMGDDEQPMALKCRVYRYDAEEQSMIFERDLVVSERGGIVTGMHCRYDDADRCAVLAVAVGWQSRLDRTLVRRGEQSLRRLSHHLGHCPASSQVHVLRIPLHN